MKPLSHSPKPRARLPRGWRKSAGVAGVLSAAAFFAAAQAGSLQPIQVEVAGLLNPLQDNSPSAKVHSPKGGAHRSYAGGGGSRGGEYVGGARAPDAANGQGVDLGSMNWAADTGTQTTDDLSDPADSPFQLPVEWSAHSAGSDASASHAAGRGFAMGGGAGGGGGSGAGGLGGGGLGAGGADRGGQAQGLAAPCCADAAANGGLDKLQSVTAPLLADTVSSAAPEPETWAVMILGLGLTGLALRGKRRRWA